MRLTRAREQNLLTLDLSENERIVRDCEAHHACLVKSCVHLNEFVSDR